MSEGKRFSENVNAILIGRGLPAIETDISKLGVSPYPAWTCSASSFAATIASMRTPTAWPPSFALVGLAGMFGLAGYSTMTDQEHGPSVATGQLKLACISSHLPANKIY
ncbi:hypothetical protein HK100_000705 [Physocladia obscura]|uniref:Uncharacterized protein n=1 Tax=Physocladia obscura TaxID=109957 RepID=A0AAD5SZQ4_9FUNG|nr:hypothetical protein HK100_000705 [Physocladia obscura]